MDSSGDGELRSSSRRSPIKPIPRYMMPNFSSLLPAYANAEADHIRSAFARTHHASIQKLPARLAPQAVNRARLEQMDANRLSLPGEGVPAGSDLSTSSVYPNKSPRTKAKTAAATTTTKNGYFQPLEYAPSPFNLPDELAQLERLQSHAHRSAISGTPFVSSSKAAKLKYEDSFGDTRFRYPHLAEPSPPPAKEVGVKRNHLRESNGVRARSVLAGEPSGFGGFGGGGGVVTRKLLPDMIRELHEVLRGDWPELNFDVAPDESSEAIVVRVREASVESEPALAAYMNVLVRSNHMVASKYGLQKVAEDWNAKPGDGALYFALRPPWAKNRSKDLVVVLASGSGL